MGATYELSANNQEKLYSVDIPPTANIEKIYKLLEDGEKEKVWFFEEGNYGRKHVVI